MLAADTRTHSQSPSRPSFGEKISALGSKLSRTLTGGESAANRPLSSERDIYGHDGKESSMYSEERDSVADLEAQKERSRSRGREVLQSTGRGGFGNIRSPSLSRDRPVDGPDDFSVTRGREMVSNPAQVYSTGRGGAGNLRSPSRDASRGPDARERELMKEYAAQGHEGAVSVGRGGLGNINTSHSRSRSRDPTLTSRVSTGRGGAGNILANAGGAEGYGANAADESERRKVEGLGVGSEGHYSTGRGGFANIAEGNEPPAVERPQHAPGAAVRSSGRGGAGNIYGA